MQRMRWCNSSWNFRSAASATSHSGRCNGRCIRATSHASWSLRSTAKAADSCDAVASRHTNCFAACRDASRRGRADSNATCGGPARSDSCESISGFGCIASAASPDSGETDSADGDATGSTADPDACLSRAGYIGPSGYAAGRAGSGRGVSLTEPVWSSRIGNVCTGCAPPYQSVPRA